MADTTGGVKVLLAPTVATSWARGDHVKVALAARESARNLDVIEQAHMLSGRSECSHASSSIVNAIWRAAIALQAIAGSAITRPGEGERRHRRGHRRHCAGSPFFNRRGRRSPSHIDRLGRQQGREGTAHETIYRGFCCLEDLKRGPPERPSYGLA